MIKNILSASGLLIVLSSASVIYAEPSETNFLDADSRQIYVGIEGGASLPVKKHFEDEDTKSKMKLTRSYSYGGKIGYSFYPQMAIELSYKHKPKYGLEYILPTQNLAPLPFSVDPTGSTKVAANVIMANLIYRFENKQIFTPYILGGIGATFLHIKPSSYAIPNHIPFLGGKEIFRLKKSNFMHLTWQVGLGLSTKLSDNLSIDTLAKLQVVPNAKIIYEKYDRATGTFAPSKFIKKTIGAGELTLGITYNFPV